MTTQYETLLQAIHDRNHATLLLAGVALILVVSYLLPYRAPRIRQGVVAVAILTWLGLLIVLGA